MSTALTDVRTSSTGGLHDPCGVPRNVSLGSPAIAALGVAALIWAYWPVLVLMAERWSNDPQFSHGWIVPVIAVFILWDRRRLLSRRRPEPAGWGLAILSAAFLLGAAGALFYLPWFEAVSFSVAFLGLAVCWGGRVALKWSWPALAYLLFMAPLPYPLQTALGGWLQRFGTVASTFGMQTLGIPAVAEGNTVVLESGARLGVVEACSGLGMMVTFFALTTAAAILVRVELWKRVVVALSAIPIAIAVNVIRILATGILASYSADRAAAMVFHDAAGWTMMPVAAALIALEFWFLNRLVIEGPVNDLPPIAIGRS